MKKTNNGFTILETVLVLALAGLILTAAFITIPNLIRTQRDTDRRSIFSKFLSSVSQYQASNRKALPSISGKNPDNTNIYQILLTFNNNTKRYENHSNGATTDWPEFFATYFNNGFEDPDGKPYQISITACNSGIATGTPCSLTYYSTNITTQTLEQFLGSHFPNNYTALVVMNAKCQGTENLTAAPGNNNVSILYKLENGGTYCENN